MGISCCMIVKDEEKYIADALNSIKDLVNEIIVVDTGSRDKTKETARKFTDKIFDFKWNDNFSDARNFSLRKANEDWILVLDADEVIAKEDHDKTKDFIKSDKFFGYAMEQISYLNDSSIYGFTPVLEKNDYSKDFAGYISCNIVRLFRNMKEIFFEGAVHESVDNSIKRLGEVKKTDLKIHHYQFEKGMDVQREKQLHYLKILEDNIENHHNKAKGYRDIGMIYYTFANDYEKAIESFKRSLELNQNNIKTYVGLALCLIKMNRYEEAREYLGKGLEISQDNQQLNFLWNFTNSKLKS